MFNTEFKLPPETVGTENHVKNNDLILTTLIQSQTRERKQVTIQIRYYSFRAL